MRILLIILLLFSKAILVNADEPLPPVPLVFASEEGSNAIFIMVPRKYDKEFKLERDAFGIAYKLNSEGILEELYRTKGWYSRQVYISMNGRYLVRIEDYYDFAIAFYKDGALIKQYSVADIVKDTNQVIRTELFYFWQAPSIFDLAKGNVTECFMLRSYVDYNNEFKVHTIDGWTYTFDVTSGKIKTKKKTENG